MNYFVSYFWVTDGDSGFGCTCVSNVEELDNPEAITKLTEAIANELPEKASVIILNWMQLK
jgi:hypothetical protein